MVPATGHVPTRWVEAAQRPSPQFFPPQILQGPGVCTLIQRSNRTLSVLSAYSQRNFSKISAYPQQIAPKYGLIRPSKSPFIGLTQTFNRSYKALENCPLKDTLKGPLKGPFCTCPSAPYKAFSSSLCLPKPPPAYLTVALNPTNVRHFGRDELAMTNNCDSN